MPLYEYRCPEGHVETHLRRDKPETLPCPCGRPAHPIISAPGVGVVSGSHTPAKIIVASAPRTLATSWQRWYDWTCDACGEKKGDFVDRTADTPEPRPTCTCGVTMREVFGAPKIKDAWFPTGGYYDLAAGQHFHTPQERRDWMEKNGLRESDNAEIENVERNASAIRSQQDRDIKEMLAEWDDDKERQRAVDQGELADHAWAKDVMGMN